MEQFTVPCVVYRGGTSRGLFFHEKDLPKDIAMRKKVFLKGIGAEDASHVNGLGGGTSHTSKVVIINQSEQPGADVDYTFVQLGMGSDIVDFEGTCGNLMAAVGAFAVDEGLVAITESMEFATVVVWNTNIHKYLNIEVPLHNGMAKVAGNYAMPGVNDSGAKYLVDIEDPSGGKTGQAIPLGASAQLEINDQALAYSFCDIVNPFVYVNATSLSLENTELNEDIMQLSPVMENLEKIRGYIAVKSGLAPSLQAARDVHVAIPKMAMVSEPKDYQTSTGKLIKKEEYDILARMVSVGKMHRTFAVSGLLNLAGACLLNGTVPNKVSRLQALREGQTVRIGHPEGIISIRVQKSMSEEKINYVGLERTARRIMSGNLYIPIH